MPVFCRNKSFIINQIHEFFWYLHSPASTRFEMTFFFVLLFIMFLYKVTVEYIKESIYSHKCQAQKSFQSVFLELTGIL